MTYLGALSHGAHTIVIHRDGRLIRWLLGTPAGPHRDTWDDLPAYWRAVLTTQARACLTAALHPTPTRGPLDGQEPLIGET